MKFPSVEKEEDLLYGLFNFAERYQPKCKRMKQWLYTDRHNERDSDKLSEWFELKMKQKKKMS